MGLLDTDKPLIHLLLPVFGQPFGQPITLRLLLYDQRENCAAPDRINPNEAPQMSMLQSVRRFHSFAEQEYRRARRQAAARQRQNAESFCDQMIAQGRLTPDLKRSMAMPLLLSLDDTRAVWRFSDGGVNKVFTAYELKKLQIARGPVIVKMGERQQEGGVRGEVNKVERFCETYSDRLKIYNHTFDPKKMIDTAKKMAERNPNFRAADLIGEDAAKLA
jgi:hypothetical protein